MAVSKDATGLSWDFREIKSGVPSEAFKKNFDNIQWGVLAAEEKAKAEAEQKEKE